VTKIIAAPADQPPYDVCWGKEGLHPGPDQQSHPPINFDISPHQDIWPLSKVSGYRDKYGVPYQGAVVGSLVTKKSLSLRPPGRLTRPEVKGRICLDRAWWLENFYLGAYLMGQTNITGKWILDIWTDSSTW